MKKKNLSNFISTNVRFKHVLARLLGMGINIMGTLVPPLGARWAAQLFTTPRRFPLRKFEKDLKAKSERSWVYQGKNRLAVYSWGKGPVILLVHGWNGRGTQFSDFIPSLLESGYRVVTFDAVGHGDSDGNRASLFDFADGIQRVVEATGEVHGIITHSMGGPATTLALTSGINANRLTYLAPPNHLATMLKTFLVPLGISEQVGKGMVRRLETRYGRRWQDIAEERLASRLDLPLLVVHDQGDQQISWQDGKSLANQWQGAQLWITQGLGHNRILHDPEVIQGVMKFIVHKPLTKGVHHENLSSPYVGTLPESIIPPLTLGSAQF